MSFAFNARCPKCDNRSFEPPEPLDVAASFTCHVCGHSARLVDFADLSTLDAIAGEIKRRALETVRGATANGVKAIG